MASNMDRTTAHHIRMKEPESPSLMVVAIDFGTSYSGYAFSTRDDFKRKTGIVYTVQPCNSGCGKLLSYKVPTCLLLNKKREFVAFGYEAESKYADLCASNEGDEYYFFERFKMKLYQGFLVEELMKPMLMLLSLFSAISGCGQQDSATPFAPTISPAMTAFDFGGKDMPAVDVFSLSIKALIDDFLEQKKSAGLTFIKFSEIKWVLTVPAIWGERAKNFMRKCAVKAGIPDEKLVIALEPECASIYCQNLQSEQLCGYKGKEAPTMGIKYMVVDMGGGTVDIAVHEKVDDHTLKELCRATGGDCGGTAVDMAFIKVLTILFGDKIETEFKLKEPEAFLNMLRSFELIKRSIKPDSKETKTNFEIPYVSLSEFCKTNYQKTLEEQVNSSVLKSHISITKGHFRIEKQFLLGLFSETLTEINSLIEKTFQNESAKEVNTIVLVGGFAESILVQRSVQTTFSGKRIIIPGECGLAVLKGALMFGHEPSFISLRIVPFTIGFQACKPYNRNLGHNREDLCIHKGTEYSKKLFHVLLERDTEVEVDTRIIMEFSTTKPFQKFIRITLFATKEKNITYTCQEGCWFIGRALIKVRKPSKEMQFVKVVFSFGNTEMEITGQHPDEDDKYEGRLDLLSENEDDQAPDIILDD